MVMRNKIVTILICIVFASCLSENESAELILRDYIEKKENQFRHHDKKEMLLFWDATISGNRSDYEKLAELAVDFKEESETKKQSFQIDKFKKLDQKVFSDKKDLDFLSKIKKSNIITDSILARQLDIIYLKILGGEFDQDKYKRLIETTMDILHYAQCYELEIDGKLYSDCEIDSIRKTSPDHTFYEKVFEAKRKLVASMYPKCLELIKMRNDFARYCGFDNYYDFLLASYEIKEVDIEKIIVELDTITLEGYESAKGVIDRFVSKRFDLEKDQLRPWHYTNEKYIFFPVKFSKILDDLFVEKDIVDITSRFYDDCDLGIRDVLDASMINSDEMESKVNYFINIDPGKDMRILSNVNNNLQGLRVMMFLCSQAATFKNISRDIPYLLIYPNPIISEGIGAFFTNDIIHYGWLDEYVGIAPKDTALMKIVSQHAYQIQKITQSRTMLVKAEFEKKLYENPDQNLGELWWELNSKYMNYNKPDVIQECDWATDDYFLLMAGATQTNLFAELVAAQLSNTIINSYEELKNDSVKITKGEFVGDFMKKNIFKYGNVLPWNELIEQATGEKLTAKYYFESIVNS